jgi:hypothetical protein
MKEGKEAVETTVWAVGLRGELWQRRMRRRRSRRMRRRRRARAEDLSTASNGMNFKRKTKK